MGEVHGRHTVVLLDDNDISVFTNTSDWNRNADEHDITCYKPAGDDSADYAGGLTRGTVPIGGFYDDGATGPSAVIEPLIGTKVDLVYRPEGDGTGKPEKTVTVLVKSYNETAPVAEMRGWTAELTMSGPVVIADQA
jgi:hypothetical protein